MAFQKPTTIQGKVSAKRVSRTMRTTRGVLAAKVWCTRYSISTAVVSDSTVKITRLTLIAGSGTIFTGGFKLGALAHLYCAKCIRSIG